MNPHELDAAPSLSIRGENKAALEQVDLAHLVNSLPGLVWAIDDEGHTDYLNSRWSDYTGLPLEALLGQGWQQAIHRDDFDSFRSSWRTLREAGNGGHIELRLRRHDGEFRWFGLQISPMNAPSLQRRWCGIASDSDEKRPETPDLRLQRFADVLPTHVVFMTPNGEVEFINRDALDFFGQSLEALKDFQAAAAIHPDDLGSVLQRLQETVLHGSPFDSTARMRRHDGTYVWVRSRMNPSRDANGNLVRYCSIQIEVDDLKRAEDLLSGEVRVLEMVARGEPLSVILDALCHLVERIAPESICSILLIEDRKRFRVGAGPSLPSDYSAILDGLAIDPATGPCALAATTKIASISPDLEHDERWRYAPWRRVATAGGLRSCWSTPILSGRDQVLGVFSLYRKSGTVTPGREQDLVIRMCKIAGISIERAQIDAALRASETELRRAHTHLTAGQRLSHTGSFTWDLLADEHIWSEEIYRIFEFEPGAKISMSMIRDAIHTEDLSAVETLLGNAQSQTSFELVFRIVVSSAVKYLHVVGHRSEQYSDRPVFLGALRDITESKTAEEALSTARAELAHVSRVMTLGALTASIAHEVNQPLSGIITSATTCLRMLSNEPPSVERARITTQRILRDGDRAAEVIRRLRDLYARKQRTLVDVDLNDAAREVLVLTASELQRNRVTLQTHFDATLPTVRGDRVQLQQVILNLVLNAADAMKEIDDRPRRIDVETRRDEVHCVRLSVRDSGIGVDPQRMDQLFEAFYTTKSHGMGVGLSISRTIIESHKGRIWASGNAGPGATFAFSLP
jgi:PAS domain S-box-containing protein